MLINTISLKLPYPPTINHYYKKGHLRLSKKQNLYRQTILSEKAINYKKTVHLICVLNKIKKLMGSLKLIAFAFPPDRRKRDNDNIRKALFDSLQYSNIFDDDSQICDDRIIRMLYDENLKGSIFIKLIETRNDYVNKFRSIFGKETA